MQHLFIKGDKNAPILLLLHGTGGDERDLLPIAQTIDEQASVLSVRGNVLENGMARFFKRLREGVFDEEDLNLRTKELAAFLDQAAEQYAFDRNNVIAVGYSNGANMAGSLLFHYESVFKAAVLFHPMVPIRGLQMPNMSQLRVFIGAGENDPICLPTETKELTSMLTSQGADVTTYWERNGHRLTNQEVDAAKEWYNQHIKAI
ncbi:alpha/beta hydrolase [Pontibacillus litoralis]|uniref:Carboxylesterase n=1 Tax=Pontibacillus litoralis JSM 072002 TaxID=1385512 RepID=A0A0A5G9N8_9BACI|nr:alpha/beta hydrolase [Pontibacillus litoralis]KGX87893.1 carboxylesterase [Pontibacillus litoralis JSM 072002]